MTALDARFSLPHDDRATEASPRLEALLLGSSCKGLVLDGIEGTLVTLEARATFDAETGALKVIGLPDASVREGALRIRSALSPIVKKLLFTLEERAAMINIAPADLRKVGRTLDLPLAMVYAALLLKLESALMRSLIFIGEVGLEGDVRPVAGTLAAAVLAKRRGLGLVCPEANVGEALIVDGPAVYGVASVAEALDVARGLVTPRADPRGIAQGVETAPGPDLSEVRGQWLARRALEIAAAGGHDLLFEGPPGSGKTMLAKRVPGILPPLDDEDALECALVHGAVRSLDPALLRIPPFRSPHHTASPIGLAGGGNPIRPGEISLAHKGVLFLDELPEFSREALEVLREPMEERVVHITRAGRGRTLPAHVLIVAAMNPCPCGFHGLLDGRCRCTPGQVQRYRSRISGPLLDRFDLRVRLKPVKPAELFDGPEGESSRAVRERVIAARVRQRERAGGGARVLNGALPDRTVREVARLGAPELAFYRRLVESTGLSARGARRLLRVSRTVADLEGAERVSEIHLSEAVAFRMGEDASASQ
jgi:magnesium chelatase family protein